MTAQRRYDVDRADENNPRIVIAQPCYARQRPRLTRSGSQGQDGLRSRSDPGRACTVAEANADPAAQRPHDLGAFPGSLSKGDPISGSRQESRRPGCDLSAGDVPDLLELVGGQLLGVVAFPL